MRTSTQFMTLFNSVYIPEPLDLLNRHNHSRVTQHLKCVTQHLKCISSQGYWMILIGHRIDGDWKAGSWLFPNYLVLLSQSHNPKTLYKFRRAWYKMAKIAQIKSSHLQPDHHFLVSHVQHSLNMPDTADTSGFDTVLSFSTSGIGWLTMGKYRTTL